ncbi:WD-40 repeat-containing protein [Streptomyces clavuligerus]|nr:WD-40 repeat-containing protein [Streptomyces clavuligerus]
MSGPGSGPGPGPAPGPGPGGRPEGGAGAWDAPDEAHRLIAKALADLVAEDPAVPPHPYLSRHLAAHAARGEVLDDDHVPPALLPWETSRNVRALLRRTGPGNQREWLKAWARIEPFVRDADPESRLTSLHLAHHTATRPRTPFTAPAAAPTAAAGGAPAAGSRVTPLWSDWTAPDNVLAVCGAPVESLTHLTSSPGRTLLVSGDREGTIRRWETHGGTFGAPLRAHGGAVQHLLPLGGELLVSGGADGAVRVWNAVRGQLLTEAAHRPRTWVSGLTLFAPPPPHPPLCLLVAHSDGRLMALDTVAFRPVDLSLPELDEAPAIVVGVGGATGADSADSADSAMRGDMCLVVAQGQGVGRWRPGEDAVTRIAEHRDEVRAAVALSPDAGGDGRFATCDESGAIRFWDAASGRETAAADPSPGVPVTALAALRVDGRPAVVSAGVDHTLRLWDAGTGRPIGAPFEGHTASPVALTALPDEARHLVSAGMDGTLRRWRAAGHGSRPARPDPPPRSPPRPCPVRSPRGPGAARRRGRRRHGRGVERGDGPEPRPARRRDDGDRLRLDDGRGRTPAAERAQRRRAAAVVHRRGRRRGPPGRAGAPQPAGAGHGRLPGTGTDRAGTARHRRGGRLRMPVGPGGTPSAERVGPAHAQRPGTHRARHRRPRGRRRRRRAVRRVGGGRRDPAALGHGGRFGRSARATAGPLRPARCPCCGGRGDRRRRCPPRRLRRRGRHRTPVGLRDPVARGRAPGRRRRPRDGARVLPHPLRPPLSRGGGPRRHRASVGRPRPDPAAAAGDRRPAEHARGTGAERAGAGGGRRQPRPPRGGEGGRLCLRPGPGAPVRRACAAAVPPRPPGAPPRSRRTGHPSEHPARE